MNTPILRTANIVLRPVSVADAPALQTHFVNGHVVKHIGAIPWPYLPDGARAYIDLCLNASLTQEIYFGGIFLTTPRTP